MTRFSLLFTVLMVLGGNVLADTPVGPMNYQGRLLDNAGIPVTGSYNFVVRVYDAASAGTLKYQENHNAVAVDDGVYNFLVGTQTKSGGDSTWSVELWNCCANLFMEIVVNGEALSPRHRLAAAPYAFQATLALTTNNALALGGKTAAEYNNVLGAICESSKGKWLELVQKCLGAGSSFPGPAMVALSTLTASTTLTNLDLTGANISGIDFGFADLSGSNFSKATLNPQGIDSANLSNTIFANVITSGAAAFTSNMTGVKVSATNLAGWNLSAANLSGSSFGYLTGCPSSLPAGFVCGEQKMPTDGSKVIFGPTMNFSDTSLFYNKYNDTELSDVNTWWSANFSGAVFDNNKIEAFSFNNSPGASFRNVTARRISWAGNSSNISFINSTFLNCNFYGNMTGADFTNANLTNVIFSTTNGASLNFAYASLTNPIFSTGPTNLSVYFEGSTVTNASFASGISNLSFNESTKIFGGMYLGEQVSYSYFMETYFSGGNISGNFTTAELANQGNGIIFYNVSFNGANFTGLVGLGNAQFTGVSWFGATCPDGYQVATQGGTCVGHFL